MIWCLEFRRVFFFFQAEDGIRDDLVVAVSLDRKSTRLNSSHQIISYAVFCLKKKKKKVTKTRVVNVSSTAMKISDTSKTDTGVCLELSVVFVREAGDV